MQPRPSSSHGGAPSALRVCIQSVDLPRMEETVAKVYADTDVRYLIRVKFRSWEATTRLRRHGRAASRRLQFNQAFRFEWPSMLPAELALALDMANSAGPVKPSELDFKVSLEWMTRNDEDPVPVGGEATWQAVRLLGVPARRAKLGLQLENAHGFETGPVLHLTAALVAHPPPPPEPTEEARRSEAELARRWLRQLRHLARLRRVQRLDAERRAMRPRTAEEIYGRGEARARGQVARLLRAYSGLTDEETRARVAYRRARRELEVVCAQSGNTALRAMLHTLAAAHDRLDAATPREVARAGTAFRRARDEAEVVCARSRSAAFLAVLRELERKYARSSSAAILAVLRGLEEECAQSSAAAALSVLRELQDRCTRSGNAAFLAVLRELEERCTLGGSGAFFDVLRELEDDCARSGNATFVAVLHELEKKCARRSNAAVVMVLRELEEKCARSGGAAFLAVHRRLETCAEQGRTERWAESSTAAFLAVLHKLKEECARSGSEYVALLAVLRELEQKCARSGDADFLDVLRELEDECARSGNAAFLAVQRRLEERCARSGNTALLDVLAELDAAYERLDAVFLGRASAGDGPTERGTLAAACRRAARVMREHVARLPMLGAQSHSRRRLCAPEKIDRTLRARALELLAVMEAAAARRRSSHAKARDLASSLSDLASSLQ